ncbi:MAG TPA: hypothetical protein VGB91_15510 [Rhizomicrobium sp.]
MVAFVLILRRGLKPQRIKPDRLWVFPVAITILALATLSNGKPPDPVAILVYVGAAAAGGALGWFTTRHIELTLDDKTGTVMSQPTLLGTAMTAGVFLARFAVDAATGTGPGGGWKGFAVQHGASLALITSAGLLFVAARGVTRAWHMRQRIHPMLAAHKADNSPSS